MDDDHQDDAVDSDSLQKKSLVIQSGGNDGRMQVISNQRLALASCFSNGISCLFVLPCYFYLFFGNVFSYD